MPPRALVVLWRVTERCDLACAFCAYDRTQRRPRLTAPSERVLAFGAKLARHHRDTGRRVLVSWLGGEPLLWAPLTTVSLAYCAHGLDLSLTTNGTRLDRPALRALLLEHYAEVTISVDGFAATHDALRGRPGLYAALARSVSQLAAEKRAAGRGPLLRANAVLMRGNIEHFAPLCRELARWGIEEITFNQLGGNDRPAFFPANRLLPQQTRDLATQMPALRRELSTMGVRLCGADDYLNRLTASSTGVPLAPADCAPGREFLFVDTEGRVAPCGFTPSEYGILLDDIDDIAALPAHFAARRRDAPARACGDCHSTQHHGKFVSPVN